MNPNETPNKAKAPAPKKPQTLKKSDAPKLKRTKKPKAPKKQQKKLTYHQQRADDLKKKAYAHRTEANAAYTQYYNHYQLHKRYKKAGHITAIAGFLVRWAIRLTSKADEAYKAINKDLPAAEAAQTPTGNTGGMDWKAWCDDIDAQIAADKARSAVLPPFDA